MMDLHAQLGFVNTRDILRRASEGRYAVPAFNFVCLEQLLAVVDACMETHSPFILQCSANVRRSLGPAMVRSMAQGAVETMKREGREVPMALHLDHGMSEEECVSCIDDGFSSVMMDGSALPYEKNIELSSRVAGYAHARGVTVEAELGVLSGTEEQSAHAESHDTDPGAAVEFVKRTAVDSLAVSIGTAHGLVKMKARKGAGLPVLRYDILEAIQVSLPGFPLVLHGASSIPSDCVETVNRHGGRLVEVQGIPEAQALRAIKSGVRKINIASDGWIAMTAAVRKSLDANQASIDPRAFLTPARQAMKEVYIRKITSVIGSAGKA
jgi:fructose-bisphosphate aldolase class II